MILLSLGFLPGRVHANSDFATYGFIENCYQRMDLGANDGTVNFLNLGGNGQFRFGQIGNPPHITLTTSFVRIEVSDISGNYNDLFNLGGGLSLSDVNFDWVDYTYDGDTFPVIQIKNTQGGGSYTVNNNWFTFGNVPSARLTIFEAGYPVSTDINFYNTLDEALTFQPGNNGSCYKFNEFNLNSITELDGLCNPIGGSTVNITPLPGSPIESYLQPNFSLTFEVFRFSDKSTASNAIINTGDWCDQCIGLGVPAGPNPVPCGCADFTFTYTLLPCDGAPAECQPLTVTKTIQICCQCDIRSPENN